MYLPPLIVASLKKVVVLTCVLMAGISYFAVQPDKNLIQVSYSALPEISPNETYRIALEVKNESGRDIRIVGLTWC